MPSFWQPAATELFESLKADAADVYKIAGLTLLPGAAKPMPEGPGFKMEIEKKKKKKS